MKMKTLGVLVGFLGIASISSAATAYNPCTTATGVNNISTDLAVGSGNTVVCGDFTFSNFAVSISGGGSAVLSIAGSPFSGFANGIATLAFQIGSVVPVIGDILLTYQVNGPLTAIDLTNGGTNVTIQEQVYDTCTNPLYSGGCSNLLATLVVTGGSGTQTSSSFVSADGITYIKKDIQYGGQGSFISDFQNSQHSAVPEPMTLSLMGVGLLGLGLLRKRIA